jgi:hypothetical protein
MKHVQSYAAAFLALALLGCGGSNARRSNTDPLAGLTTPRVEAIVRVERASLQHPERFTDEQLLDPMNQEVFEDLLPGARTVFGFQDPLNFQTGENYVFQLAAYRADGSRVVLPATFASSDFDHLYGSLASNTGVFLGSNQTTTTDQTIRATFNGVEYQTQFALRPRQARVIGKVDINGSAPIDGVVIRFYDPSGLVVGSVTTAIDGSFRATVPQGAASFTVAANSLPANLYRVFTYEGNVYEPSNPGCKAPLPVLGVGSQIIGTISLTERVEGQPAPELTGCTG